MKNKNIIYGLGVAVLLYFLFKSKKGKQVTEKVTEKVKETITPNSNEKIYKGMEVDGSATNLRMQYVQIPPTIMEKVGFTSPMFTTPKELFFIENSKGERRDVVRASKKGVVISEMVGDGKESTFLPRGSSFVLYKEKLT